MPSFNQWVQSFKTFSIIEKTLFLVFLICFISSLIFLINGFYNKNTALVPAYGGTLIEGVLGQPKHINPIYSITSDVDKDIVQLVFSGLMKYGSDGKIENDLIEDYSFSGDFKYIDFKIREDVLWHNKKRLTIDDVIFTFNTIQDADYLSPLRTNFIGVSLEKISDFEARFKLTDPYPGFLENLVSFKVIPEHIFKNVPSQNFVSSNDPIIGSGPYKVYKVKENMIQLRANENYYNGKPFIKEIIFKFYANEKELENALLKKQVDNAHLSASIDYNHISYTTPSYFGLFFNTKNEILENREIRQALSLAMNREGILNDSAYQALSSPILSHFYNLEETDSEYDLEKSVQILENNDFELDEDNLRVQRIEKINNANINQDLEVGSSGRQVQMLQECLANFYEDQRVTSYFGNETKENVIRFQEDFKEEILTPAGLNKGTGKVGLSTRSKLNDVCFKGESTLNSLEFNLRTTNYIVFKEIAENIKNQFAEIGVKINVEIYDNSQIKQIIRERDYDMILFGEKLTAMPNLLPYFHSTQIFDPGLNISLWQNEKIDDLLLEIRSYDDFNEDLIKSLKEFEKIFLEENPGIILFSPNYMYYVSPKINGYSGEKLVSGEQRFNNIQNLFIKTKKIWKKNQQLDMQEK